MRSEEEQASSPIAEPGWFDREVAWLRAGARETRWIALAVLSALLLDLIVIATLSTGPINVFHNDVLLLLDDGWRVLNGQVPHRDFNSPLGPVEFWLIGAGMLLSHGSAQGIAFSIGAFGFVAGIWSWLLCRGRMPVIFGLLVTTWIVFTATCPTPLGFDPRFLSCAMIYNRQGYALVGIILVECAFARDKSRFLGGVSSGLALIVLVFLKLNFFGISALLVLATLPIQRADFSRLRGLLSGSSVGVLALLFYPRFSFEAFFTDMSFVARARGSSLNLPGLFHGAVTSAESGSVWVVAGVALVILVLVRPAERRHHKQITMGLISLIVLASGPIFLATNSLENHCQLASLWIIILLDRVSALHLRIRDSKIVTLIAIAACLGALATALVPEVSSTLSLLTYQSATQRPAAVRIQAPGMERVRFYDSTSFYDKVKAGDGDGAYYASCLSDGLSLIDSHTKADESILAVGFHNPFSYLLRRKPAEGGSSYLYMGNSISENAMPPVGWVFGNADLIILPIHEGTHHASDEFIQNYYRSYLEQNFHFVAKSQCWSLYRRDSY